MSEHHSIVIIGAGLSGLYSAWRLKEQYEDVILLEARERVGGRVYSPDIQNSSAIGSEQETGLIGEDNNLRSGRVDMGPAWVWPQLQPRVQQLLAAFNIKLFRQFTQGDMIVERDTGRAERYSGESAHRQSYRISGGGSALTGALLSCLEDDQLHLNTQVHSIDKQGLVIRAACEGQLREYSADSIILALPLRLMQQGISFTPRLDPEVEREWNSTSTWMAGHCKMVFVYDRPFWREQNFSGEVFSQLGPLTEIYDGSPENEAFYALTSFVGLSAYQREQLGEATLKEASLAQLSRLFGKQSQQPDCVLVRDWSRELYTTAALDLTSIATHPAYPDSMPRDLWDKRLILAGTESAREHGGYLEGALESADEALAILGL